MELGDNEELKSAIGIALSLLGGKNVKDIIRTILRGLMSRQLRIVGNNCPCPPKKTSLSSRALYSRILLTKMAA
ncbi:Uncharacterized protein APZ42_002474 [Daphnia magna]|uniref:Uncharacterized protein n=1 Tax=Daphnia magna TaxID=35525 RepID=A0A164I8S4_9CRUS|nr:Uncharacterized protein APZ42_002474 [Daphnia magna]